MWVDSGFEFAPEQAQILLPPEVAHREFRSGVRRGKRSPRTPFHADTGLGFAASSSPKSTLQTLM